MAVPSALRAVIIGALAATLAVSCGGTSPDTGGASNGLEKTNLTVGMIPIVDAAPFFLAKQRGFFADEGLSVEEQVISGSADAISKVQGGSLDVTFATYTSAFQAIDKGLPLRVLSEAYVAKPGVLPIMVKPDSEISEPKDLADKTIAVQSLKNVQTVLARSVLETHGVDINSVEFVQVPIADMLDALKRGQVDAVGPAEPFNTQIEQELGARTVIDLGSGPTADWPMAGWITSQEFEDKNPNTAAAFTRALQKAQELANDRKVVEEVLPSYTDIDKRTASLISIGSFPATISQTRLQRVSDRMYEFGLIDNEIDAAELTS